MTTPFLYVDGDETKTPVVLADQPQGTKLVYVDENGRDTHFLAGKRIENSAETIRTRFERTRSRPRNEG